MKKTSLKKMQMSRTPVREALLVLENEKLVENQERLGFIVRRPTVNEIQDYLNIRDVLEKYAAAQIVDQITVQEMDALKNNLKEAEDFLNAKDTQNFILCNGLFHELLSAATHSSTYCRLMSSLDNISIILRIISLRNQEAMRQSLNGHKEILTFLQTRDADGLKASLAKHLDGIRRDIESLYWG